MKSHKKTSYMPGKYWWASCNVAHPTKILGESWPPCSLSTAPYAHDTRVAVWLHHQSITLTENVLWRLTNEVICWYWW